MCNETLARTLGYAKTDIVGRLILEFVPEEFHASSKEVWATALKSGTVTDYECQLRRRDGSIIDVLVNVRSEQLKGGNVGIHVAMHDITEKKRTERELLHFANALSQTADTVMVTDRNGIIQYVNSAFEQL
jgi:PAS domain S-box-containing protein